MTAMTETAAAALDLGTVFETHRRELVALVYRITGSAADADDAVQETFARALARPPSDRSLPWKPWLVRVAVNLARDELRRRRRRAYRGPWLPEPVEEAELVELSHEPPSTEGRYALLESASYAFLVALEALTPTQRAVLVLCDVLEYSGREAARALDLSEANVRTTLHRAHRAMAGYDAERCPPGAELRGRTEEVLGRFLGYLASGDVAGIESLLAEGVVAVNDGGGVYAAAGVPVIGRNKVARFHASLGRGVPSRFAIRVLNGLPAFVGEYDATPPQLAPRFAMIALLDRAGRIRAIHTIVAPMKLARIRKLSEVTPRGG